MTTEVTELSAFFELPEVDRDTFSQYADAAHVSFHARERFDDLTNEYRSRVESGSGDALRLALGLLIVGRYGEALEAFEKAPAGPLRHYYAAEAALALNRFDEAIDEFRKAGGTGADACETDMRIAAIHVRTEQLDEARKLVEKHASDGQQRCEWHHVRGLLAEADGDRVAALEAFDAALEQKETYTPALFRAARLHDQAGNESQALNLYDRLTQQPRAYVNALLNAAVIYEDRGSYNDAAECLRRVLKAYPNHTRARLFMKSVESCREMIIEESGEEPIDARTRLLATPLSEFELSVRARNCLKKMNIRLVGELMRLSESELLAYKNFGETSLNEIKALLAKKGLRLGQNPEEIEAAAPEEPAPQKPSLPPGREALLSKPVSELELSVRSRRCLQRLNVRTLADLLQFSEADLLATRNFGVTSLNEIKARLDENGLQLANKS